MTRAPFLLAIGSISTVLLISAAAADDEDPGKFCTRNDTDCQTLLTRPYQVPVMPSSFTWFLGFFYVTIISLSSCIGLLIVPTTTSRINLLHNAFEGLALGSLLASAIFHLIPHAFELVGEDHEHSYLFNSLMIFAGIQLFLLSERIMVLVSDYQAKSKKGLLKRSRSITGDNQQNLRDRKDSIGGVCSMCERQRTLLDNAVDGAESNQKQSTLAWMVIFGDGLHNFIDGLSLGAALADGHLTGFSIAIAILFEEIPHELGDFAILIASGMPPRTAAFYNFLSASTCYAGMVFGLLIGGLDNRYQSVVFAVAGGMFLYISLFNVMSELNERFNDSRQVNLSTAIRVLLAQNIGIVSGISFLYYLAKFDERAFVNLIS